MCILYKVLIWLETEAYNIRIGRQRDRRSSSFAQYKAKTPAMALVYMPLFGDTSSFLRGGFLLTKNLGNLDKDPRCKSSRDRTFKQLLEQERKVVGVFSWHLKPLFLFLNS